MLRTGTETGTLVWKKNCEPDPNNNLNLKKLKTGRIKIKKFPVPGLSGCGVHHKFIFKKDDMYLAEKNKKQIVK